jgi:hypothetical protein
VGIWVPVGNVESGARQPGLSFGVGDSPSVLVARPCADIPAGDDLPNTSEEVSFLSRTAAMSLGLPILGVSGDASADQRVWMSEWKRYRTCQSPDGEVRYGVAVRLIVSVSSLNANIDSSTLAGIAAQATLGSVQARVQLSALGYTGPIPANAQIQWAPLSVENYATVIASAGELRALIQAAPVSALSPVLLAIETGTDSDDRHLEALGHVWALGAIAEGRSAAESQARLPEQFRSPAALGAIIATYEAIAGQGASAEQRPDARARVTAEMLVGPFRLRKGLFG